MKRSYIYFIFIVILLSSVSACNVKGVVKENNFNFILNYGVMGGNQIDTFKGTYTKDMVMASSVTTKLRLTKSDMNSILAKMQEIEIFDYPDNFDENPNLEITPPSMYKFKIEYNNKIKEIVWIDKKTSDYKAEQLRELVKMIMNIVKDKAEYKKLPQSVGGYI